MRALGVDFTSLSCDRGLLMILPCFCKLSLSSISFFRLPSMLRLLCAIPYPMVRYGHRGLSHSVVSEPC